MDDALPPEERPVTPDEEDPVVGLGGLPPVELPPESAEIDFPEVASPPAYKELRGRPGEAESLASELYVEAAEIAPGVADDVHVVRSVFSNRLLVRLERRVFSHRLAEWDEAVEVPKNWWQHLRATLGFPAKTVRTEFRVVRKRTYPEFPALIEGSFVQEDRWRR